MVYSYIRQLYSIILLLNHLKLYVFSLNNVLFMSVSSHIIPTPIHMAPQGLEPICLSFILYPAAVITTHQTEIYRLLNFSIRLILILLYCCQDSSTPFKYQFHICTGHRNIVVDVTAEVLFPNRHQANNRQQGSHKNLRKKFNDFQWHIQKNHFSRFSRPCENPGQSTVRRKSSAYFFSKFQWMSIFLCFFLVD